MGSKEWQEAAEIYQEQKQVEVLKDQQIKETARLKEQQIKDAIQSLEEFLNSEDGYQARFLLRASGRHITIASERGMNGYGQAFFIDGNGLQVSVEATGMWVAYARDIKPPRISPATAAEAIHCAAYQDDPQDPTKIVPAIIRELDRIAKEAQRKP